TPHYGAVNREVLGDPGERLRTRHGQPSSSGRARYAGRFERVGFEANRLGTTTIDERRDRRIDSATSGTKDVRGLGRVIGCQEVVCFMAAGREVVVEVDGIARPGCKALERETEGHDSALSVRGVILVEVAVLPRCPGPQWTAVGKLVEVHADPRKELALL